MSEELYETIEKQIREHVVNNLPLSQLSDDELREKIEELSVEYFSNKYIPIDKKVEIVEQVYSSIRGFGILDTIMKDDSITEVMINGKDNIFIAWILTRFYYLFRFKEKKFIFQGFQNVPCVGVSQVPFAGFYNPVEIFLVYLPGFVCFHGLFEFSDGCFSNLSMVREMDVTAKINPVSGI